LKFLKKAMRRHGCPDVIVTGGLRPYGPAMREFGDLKYREVGQWKKCRLPAEWLKSQPLLWLYDRVLSASAGKKRLRHLNSPKGRS